MKANAHEKKVLSCLVLDQYPLNKVGSMLHGTNLTNNAGPNDQSSIFSVKRLHH